MKANIVQFESKLTVEEAAGIFQVAVRRRPLRLKVLRFTFFTPTPADDPFAAVDGSIAPDFEVGASFSLPGPDPAMGSVIFGAIDDGGGSKLMLTSVGNMRGRMFTNSLLKHVLGKFTEADPGIEPEEYSSRR